MRSSSYSVNMPLRGVRDAGDLLARGQLLGQIHDDVALHGRALHHAVDLALLQKVDGRLFAVHGDDDDILARRKPRLLDGLQ